MLRAGHGTETEMRALVTRGKRIRRQDVDIEDVEEERDNKHYVAAKGRATTATDPRPPTISDAGCARADKQALSLDRVMYVRCDGRVRYSRAGREVAEYLDDLEIVSLGLTTRRARARLLTFVGGSMVFSDGSCVTPSALCWCVEGASVYANELRRQNEHARRVGLPNRHANFFPVADGKVISSSGLVDDILFAGETRPYHLEAMVASVLAAATKMNCVDMIRAVRGYRPGMPAHYDLALTSVDTVCTLTHFFPHVVRSIKFVRCALQAHRVDIFTYLVESGFVDSTMSTTKVVAEDLVQFAPDQLQPYMDRFQSRVLLLAYAEPTTVPTEPLFTIKTHGRRCEEMWTLTILPLARRAGRSGKAEVVQHFLRVLNIHDFVVTRQSVARWLTPGLNRFESGSPFNLLHAMLESACEAEDRSAFDWLVRDRTGEGGALMVYRTSSAVYSLLEASTKGHSGIGEHLREFLLQQREWTEVVNTGGVERPQIIGNMVHGLLHAGFWQAYDYIDFTAVDVATLRSLIHAGTVDLSGGPNRGVGKMLIAHPSLAPTVLKKATVPAIRQLVTQHPEVFGRHVPAVLLALFSAVSPGPQGDDAFAFLREYMRCTREYTRVCRQNYAPTKGDLFMWYWFNPTTMAQMRELGAWSVHHPGGGTFTAGVMDHLGVKARPTVHELAQILQGFRGAAAAATCHLKDTLRQMYPSREEVLGLLKIGVFPPEGFFVGKGSIGHSSRMRTADQLCSWEDPVAYRREFCMGAGKGWFTNHVILHALRTPSQELDDRVLQLIDCTAWVHLPGNPNLCCDRGLLELFFIRVWIHSGRYTLRRCISRDHDGALSLSFWVEEFDGVTNGMTDPEFMKNAFPTASRWAEAPNLGVIFSKLVKNLLALLQGGVTRENARLWLKQVKRVNTQIDLISQPRRTLSSDSMSGEGGADEADWRIGLG